MAGNFPFATESLSSLKIVKPDGESLDIIPWDIGTNPLIAFSLNESMFSPLMTGTLVIRDTGEWLGTYGVRPNDEIHFNLNAKTVSGTLNRDRNDSFIKNYSLIFEVTNVKNTVTLSTDEFQNSSETIKALTIEFITKSILNKEFLSSVLDNENFIGYIYSDEPDTFQLSGLSGPSVELRGFNSYLKEKFEIEIDGDKTWNYCYLKKNNVSYPWGKIQGQQTLLQTLEYLAENAVNYDNNAAVNYAFWQDLHGYHFKCVDSLIKNNTTAEDFVFTIGENQFSPNNIHAFETVTEFDNLKLLNSNVYYSWYERILPNYADPYLDFIDTSLGLTRQNIIFDIQSEYDKFSHLEDKSLIPEGLSFGSSLSQSQRIDDDIYGFYSKNRYNTPFPQSWEYLGLSADTRLSNVVWQNQFDLDDEVYPEILYAYDKLIKKSLITNREKYTKLKNAKRKWEVYRCSICCMDQIGGTADQAILKNLSSENPDYLYYFGATGIFKDFSTDYSIVAGGAFSDVVNYDMGVTSGNGLTLSYDMNSYPYNQTIAEFYNLKTGTEDIDQTVNNALTKYVNELDEVQLLIPRIEEFVANVDSWIVSATELAYQNLTPDFKKTCSKIAIPPQAYNGPGTGNLCCNRPLVGYCSIPFFGYPRAGVVELYYKNSPYGSGFLKWNFDTTQCDVARLPLYVNLRYDDATRPLDFSGHWESLINPQFYEIDNDQYPWYVTALGQNLNCESLVDGPLAYELPFIKPDFLYTCSKTKLLKGKYFSTFEHGEIKEFDLFANWLDDEFLNGVENGTIWCETCLDPLALQAAKFEYIKILKELKLRKFVIDELIAKLTILQTKYRQLYQEYLNRKAFFISKNPFDKEAVGNILNKKSSLSLFNIKSIKRKPIRGSRYEVLGKRMGITSGISSYVYNVYFDDNNTRNTGITGNHPYYDQKFKGFSYGAYASKPGFNTFKLDFADLVYYDNSLTDITDLLPSPMGLDPVPNPIQTPGYLIYDSINLIYPTGFNRDSDGSISDYISPQTLSTLTNQLNVFNDNASKIPSIEKEKISSYVRIEFINPIGLDKLSDFPSGFVRDAGSEYFLPYLVQLTAGPNGRQTIQNNVAVIGIDPYGFDVAIKKNRTKNNYSDYKEWGNYWWYTPFNKLRLSSKTKDVNDMSLWAESSFENEKTYYENNGEYVYNVGEDFTEFDNYSGAISPVFKGASQYEYGAFYPVYYNNDYFVSLNKAIDNINNNSKYYIPTGDNTVEINKIADIKNINHARYGSYNLIGSHLHYNVRRSWYDFVYPSKLYFDTVLTNIANINNLADRFNYIKTETIINSNDIVAFGGNDFIQSLENSIALKDTATLRTFLNQNEITNLHLNNLFDIEQMNQIKGLTSSTSIFTDDIERYLSGDLFIYRPGLVTSQVWLYDIFGESEYGLTSPPTLPPEYDLFDNNFAAQFVVFGKSSGSNICKDLGLKCLNPKGKTDNSNCEPDDPYCNCPSKNLIPTEKEPSYKELAIAYENTKECKLIEDILGPDYLGCMLSDPENTASCNCPEQGKYYPTFLNTLRSNATFYVTPPKTPLRRQAQMSLLTAQQAIMTIYPNDALKIGDIVTVNRGYARGGKDTINGKWMVTGISRVFKSINVELMVLNISRDSIKDQII